MQIITFPRSEFLAERWSYRAGEHVTFLGPTGCGKTELKWDLLQHTATRDVPVTVFATKPRDRTTSRWAKELGYPRVPSYPPPFTARRYFNKPMGYVLWPKHTFDPEIDDLTHGRVFSDALRHIYRVGDQIVDVDEALDLEDLEDPKNHIYIRRDMRTLWTRGRAMGAGLWTGTQQPFHIQTHAYRQCSHLFIAKDPDKRSRERYDEIGGIDPGLIREIVMSLRQFQFLYVRRRGPAICIVDK